jgi:hypothetical protein
MGRARYPAARRLMITADCGGSNSPETDQPRCRSCGLTPKCGIVEALRRPDRGGSIDVAAHGKDTPIRPVPGMEQRHSPRTPRHQGGEVRLTRFSGDGGEKFSPAA